MFYSEEVEQKQTEAESSPFHFEKSFACELSLNGEQSRLSGTIEKALSLSLTLCAFCEILNPIVLYRSYFPERTAKFLPGSIRQTLRALFFSLKCEGKIVLYTLQRRDDKEKKKRRRANKQFERFVSRAGRKRERLRTRSRRLGPHTYPSGGRTRKESKEISKVRKWSRLFFL